MARRMFKIPYTDHITNLYKEVMKTVNTESFLSKSIQIRKCQYFGFVVRAAYVCACVRAFVRACVCGCAHLCSAVGFLESTCLSVVCSP